MNSLDKTSFTPKVILFSVPWIVLVTLSSVTLVFVLRITLLKSPDKLPSPSLYCPDDQGIEISRKPVCPGDVLMNKVEKKQQIKNIWKFTCRSFVNNELVSQAEISAILNVP